MATSLAQIAKAYSGYSKPKLPPRNVRPKAPTFHPAPAPKTPTIYRWGQSNPAYSSGPPSSTPRAAPAAAAAPTAPAAPAARTPAQLPVDPVYDAQVGAYGHQRDDTLAGLTQAQTGTLADYGYGATFDANGNVTGLTFDPNNPYSRAALLRKNYQQSKTGTANTMASRGQLYGGAFGQAQNIEDNRYQQNENDLQKALTGSLSSIAQKRRQAGTDYETNVANAFGERTARAAASDTGDSAFTDGSSSTSSTAGPASYSGARGLVGGKYIDKDGGIHAVQTKAGKKYYLGSSGKWIPV